MAAQPEGFDQPSSPTVPRMIVLRTATLTNNMMYVKCTGGSRKFTVPGAGVYTAQILRKSGSDVNSLSVSVWSFPHSSSTDDKKSPYWLRSSSQYS